MKAELMHLSWTPERTHDLRKLTSELEFLGRCPGFDLEPPDWPELRDHVEQTYDILHSNKISLSPLTPE